MVILPQKGIPPKRAVFTRALIFCRRKGNTHLHSSRGVGLEPDFGIIIHSQWETQKQKQYFSPQGFVIETWLGEPKDGGVWETKKNVIQVGGLVTKYHFLTIDNGGIIWLTYIFTQFCIEVHLCPLLMSKTCQKPEGLIHKMGGSRAGWFYQMLYV